VIFRASGEPHARAYYAAEALGVLDTMNTAMFQAIHVDRKLLASEDQLEALFTANGVSAEDFTRAFNSFGVNAQVNQAVALAKSAQIHATPTLVVNGKYRVSAGQGGHPEMLKVANYLIEKERTAGGG
jgi:thiol:disulfide interchange protein DsbA